MVNTKQNDELGWNPSCGFSESVDAATVNDVAPSADDLFILLQLPLMLLLRLMSAFVMLLWVIMFRVMLHMTPLQYKQRMERFRDCLSISLKLDPSERYQNRYQGTGCPLISL